MKITLIHEGTPAFQSGVQPDDFLLEVDGKIIQKPSDVLDIAFHSKVGKKISVKVERGKELLVYEIEVTERPSPNIDLKNGLRPPTASPKPQLVNQSQ